MSFSYSSTKPVVQPGFSPACRHTEHFIFYLSSGTARRIPFVASEPHPTLYCLVRQRLQGISTWCICGVAAALPCAEKCPPRCIHSEAANWRLPSLCSQPDLRGPFWDAASPWSISSQLLCCRMLAVSQPHCASVSPGEEGLSDKRSLQSHPKESAVGGLGWGLGICLLNKFSQVILLQGVQSVSV